MSSISQQFSTGEISIPGPSPRSDQIIPILWCYLLTGTFSEGWRVTGHLTLCQHVKSIFQIAQGMSLCCHDVSWSAALHWLCHLYIWCDNFKEPQASSNSSHLFCRRRNWGLKRGGDLFKALQSVGESKQSNKRQQKKEKNHPWYNLHYSIHV